MDTNLSKLQEIVEDREAWCATVHEVTRIRHDLAAEEQQQLYSTENSAKYYVVPSKKSGYMYMSNCFTLLYAWKYHNIVNQLYSN